MNEKIDYKKNENFKNLDNEITKIIPNFQSIELALNNTSPLIISNAIIDDIGFTYLIDYYFNYVSNSTVLKIIQNPFFERNALIELFSIRITSFHKSILLNQEQKEIISGYWTLLSKAEIASLFLEIFKSTDFETVKNLIPKIDFSHIKLMTKTGTLSSKLVLKFFNTIGDELHHLAAHNIELYEYALQVAQKENDNKLIERLEDLTGFFVQLRIASYFVEHIQNKLKNNEKLVYMDIVNLSKEIPSDSLETTLNVFKEKKWITEDELQSIINIQTTH
jgi:hypothetical protein